MFSRQAAVVDGVITKSATPIDLCRNNQVISFPAKLFDGLTHHNFRFAFSVTLGTVEEVDPGIVCSFHAFEGDLCHSVSDALMRWGRCLTIAYRPAISDPVIELAVESGLI